MHCRVAEMTVAKTNLPPALSVTASFRAAADQLLPPYVGNALHGAFGHALYASVCAFPRRRRCEGCPVGAQCAYPLLFASRGRPTPEAVALGVHEEAPRPLAMAPEPAWAEPALRPRELRAGEPFEARLTLIGRAVAALPVVVLALKDLARRGLGIGEGDRGADIPAERPSLVLERVVTAGGHVVYDRVTDCYAPPGTGWENGVGEDTVVPEAVVLRLVTPLRLKLDGRIARDFTPADLARSLARRANALSLLYGAGEPVFDERSVARAGREVDCVRSDLRRVEVRRYSSRQRQRMNWPGLMGEVEWRGPGLARLWPLLCWGERAQVGKATTFGFGRYALER